MSKRKDTPDLLGDILGGGTSSASPTPPKQKSKRKKLVEKKARSTVHLTQDTEAEFSIMQAKLRRVLGHKVSRSEIIEACLYRAIEDFNERGEASWIAELLPELFDL